MSLPPMENFDHQVLRAQTGRQAYIAWRMNDLPAIYQNLMPVTCELKELWEAETHIREQHAIDLRLNECPWRHIGPSAIHLMDCSGMNESDMTVFGLQISVPRGYPGAVKPGRNEEVIKHLVRQQRDVRNMLQDIRVDADGKFVRLAEEYKLLDEADGDQYRQDRITAHNKKESDKQSREYDEWIAQRDAEIAAKEGKPADGTSEIQPLDQASQNAIDAAKDAGAFGERGKDYVD